MAKSSYSLKTLGLANRLETLNPKPMDIGGGALETDSRRESDMYLEFGL